ncbi:uncharacterized protein LOC121980200 [Zingiber officinale]|uniref:uncharacterized protein LOC121980200 n=1 Tax=Zingiber officinale TaxID=94328 RepID=UPI001C4C6B40|nr:uncharacterized protein LOC121980200 [Zingiber officinale]
MSCSWTGRATPPRPSRTQYSSTWSGERARRSANSSDSPAFHLHFLEWSSANSVWSCYWKWVASHSGLCKCECLLPDWTPHRHCSWIQDWFSCGWNMVGVDNWSLCSNGLSHRFNCQDKLEQRSGQGDQALEAYCR